MRQIDNGRRGEGEVVSGDVEWSAGDDKGLVESLAASDTTICLRRRTASTTTCCCSAHHVVEPKTWRAAQLQKLFSFSSFCVGFLFMNRCPFL